MVLGVSPDSKSGVHEISNHETPPLGGLIPKRFGDKRLLYPLMEKFHQ